MKRTGYLERNDYDRVANQAQAALVLLISSTHGTLSDTDSVTVTQTGWIDAVVEIQRAIDYARGLAATHAALEAQRDHA